MLASFKPVEPDGEESGHYYVKFHLLSSNHINDAKAFKSDWVNEFWEFGNNNEHLWDLKTA